MKKYIAKSNRFSLVSLDLDTSEVDLVDSDYVINTVYPIEEAGELYLDNEKVADVAENGVIIKLYPLRNGKPMFICLEHDKLTEYLQKKKEEEKEVSERVLENNCVPCKSC